MKFHHIAYALKDVSSFKNFYTPLKLTEASELFEDKRHEVFIQFYKLKNITFEFIAPINSKSHLNNFLKKNIGYHHLAFKVKNLESFLQNLNFKESKIISNPKKAIAFNNRKVAFILNTNKQLIELIDE